ncbi:MAG TPA: hypothetical protein VKS25_13495 [Solirubrobacteraceae bacterium]|nr:hypothetical protein [Solirubrobacteraceae bacterium]
MLASKLKITICGLVVAGALSLAVSSAQAKVLFPTPGAMTFAGLPAQIRAGHMWNLRELMPYAIQSGEMLLEHQTAPGTWTTIVTGKIRPRILWLHWRVPRSLAGAQLVVRFVLVSQGELLATSPNYAIAIGH